jgi:methylthioribose-1-phosphate isomerase
VLAHHHGVPFVVVAPTSTLDLATAAGADIVVEQRAAAEVTAYAGVPVCPAGSAAYNPAFDVTPPQLLTALVTEVGVAQPVNHESVAALVALSIAACSR